MAQSLAQFERRITAVQDEFTGVAGRARLARVAKASEGDVTEAVRGDLGDTSMSGWRRGAPVQVVGASRVLGDSEAMVSAGRASGVMRVLQAGRNQGGFAGPAAQGRTVRRRKNGTLTVKGGKARRWNGRTQGKGTWDDAAELLADRVPGRIAAETHKAIAKHLRGG